MSALQATKISLLPCPREDMQTLSVPLPEPSLLVTMQQAYSVAPACASALSPSSGCPRPPCALPWTPNVTNDKGPVVTEAAQGQL